MSRVFIRNFKISEDRLISGDHTIAGSSNLKRVLIKRGLLNLSCYICNLSTWLDKPITLQLDHIDGNSCNDALNNLRLLCPNCHSQTDTFCGRNAARSGKGNRKLCINDCGRVITQHGNKIGYCDPCRKELGIEKPRIDPYMKMEICDLFLESYIAREKISQVKMGEKYGVCWRTIHNILKSERNLPYQLIQDGIEQLPYEAPKQSKTCKKCKIAFETNCYSRVFCQGCTYMKSVWPTREELQALTNIISVPNIAKKFETTPATIRYWAKQLGVRIPIAGYWNSKNSLKPSKEELQKLLENNSVKKVCEILQVGEWALTSWRKEYDLTIAIQNQTKIVWPETSVLNTMVKEFGYEKTGCQLGVSRNAVKNRIKNHS